MRENQITVLKFSEENFKGLVCPEAVSRGEPISTQVTYLIHYFQRLGAHTIICENHYIDRHYLDEYVLYYSRMLSAPPNFVKRLHVFSHSISEEKFNELIVRSIRSESERKAVEDELMSATQYADKGYLGFCSIRPIESTPIGRTVLIRLPQVEPPREILTNVHNVHLANLNLQVDGLAFQEQDAAVGACATAALWCALVKVMRQDGMRSPTPAEVSDAAIPLPRTSPRHMLPVNTGNNIDQLCQVIRAMGFSPELIPAWGRPEECALAIHTYLLSGIPLVLILYGGGKGHAVTAVGFQMTTSEHERLDSLVPTRSRRLSKLYVHDDRIGPYAKAQITPFTAPPPSEEETLPTGEEGEISLSDGLSFNIDREGSTSESFVLDYVIAPVYPKIRLPVSALLTFSVLIHEYIEGIVGTANHTNLRVDFRYEQSGDYLSKLSGRAHNYEAAPVFIRSVSFSRWCAVIRWYLNEVPLVEFIYDTTDVLRDEHIQNRELLRGIVWLSETFSAEASGLGEIFKVPFL